MCKTDLEIAQECVMDPILNVAEKIGLNEDDLEYYGKYKAKLSLDVLERNKEKKDGKLDLGHGDQSDQGRRGKSTTTVGLGDALHRIGKKAMVALREPSLGRYSD